MTFFCERVAMRYNDHRPRPPSMHTLDGCPADPGSNSETAATIAFAQCRISKLTVDARRISWRCVAVSGLVSISRKPTATDNSSRRHSNQQPIPNRGQRLKGGGASSPSTKSPLTRVSRRPRLGVLIAADCNRDRALLLSPQTSTLLNSTQPLIKIFSRPSRQMSAAETLPFERRSDERQGKVTPRSKTVVKSAPLCQRRAAICYLAKRLVTRR